MQPPAVLEIVPGAKNIYMPIQFYNTMAPTAKTEPLKIINITHRAGKFVEFIGKIFNVIPTKCSKQ
jgi:hypothetical protein